MSPKIKKAAKIRKNTIDSSQIETTLDQGSHFINGTRRSHRLHTVSGSVINQEMPSLGQESLGRTKPLPPAPAPAPAPDLAPETPNSATLSLGNTTAKVEKTNSKNVGIQSSEGAHSWFINSKLWSRVIFNRLETDMFVSCTSQEASDFQET